MTLEEIRSDALELLSVSEVNFFIRLVPIVKANTLGRTIGILYSDRLMRIY